jgi:hypothetical protein
MIPDDVTKETLIKEIERLQRERNALAIQNIEYQKQIEELVKELAEHI